MLLEFVGAMSGRIMGTLLSCDFWTYDMTTLPDLPPELMRAIASFVTNKSHGSIVLNFNGGRLVNFDAKIHSLLRSWPGDGVMLDTDKDASPRKRELAP